MGDISKMQPSSMKSLVSLTLEQGTKGIPKGTAKYYGKIFSNLGSMAVSKMHRIANLFNGGGWVTNKEIRNELKERIKDLTDQVSKEKVPEDLLKSIESEVAILQEVCTYMSEGRTEEKLNKKDAGEETVGDRFKFINDALTNLKKVIVLKEGKGQTGESLGRTEKTRKQPPPTSSGMIEKLQKGKEREKLTLEESSDEGNDVFLIEEEASTSSSDEYFDVKVLPKKGSRTTDPTITKFKDSFDRLLICARSEPIELKDNDKFDELIEALSGQTTHEEVSIKAKAAFDFVSKTLVDEGLATYVDGELVCEDDKLDEFYNKLVLDYLNLLKTE